MKFYDKYFESNYDELITYYPRYYRDVFEMVEILKAHGRIADELEANIETTYLNCFIDYADEATITKLEKFLMIGLNKSRTLEERRRLVKSYFVGFGKVSASMLAEMIASYTGAAVNIYFEPFDDEGNNRLYIEFERGEEPMLYMSDINLLLSKKIPAHIEYRATLTYRYGIGIGRKRKYYKYGYDLCGTLPDIALIGDLQGVTSVIRTQRKNYTNEYSTASEEADTLTGTIPNISSLGSYLAVSSVSKADRENYTTDYKTAQEEVLTGLQPSLTALGAISTINAGTEATATNYGADYIYCSEDLYAQS